MGAMLEKIAMQVAVVEDVLAGILANAQVDLYQAPVSLNQEATTADLVAAKANYDGYAQANIDWQTASLSDDGHVELVGIVDEFRPTGNNVDNGIVGAYVTANGDNSLLMFGEFDDGPLPMGTVLDALHLVIRYRPKSNTLLIAIT